jgi:hypothetical protein
MEKKHDEIVAEHKTMETYYQRVKSDYEKNLAEQADEKV